MQISIFLRITKFLLILLILLLVSIPIVHAYTPVNIYGQADFTSNGVNRGGGAGADTFNTPLGITLDAEGGLYVADRDNHRVLYFANDGNTSADRVYGQAGNFGTNMVNNDGAGNYGEPTENNFGAYILGITIDSDDGIYVSDSSNHRILYFANDGDTTADRVYGQWDNFNTDTRNNDGTGRIGATSANSLNFPRGLAVDATNGLYVADRDNNRILYFANDGNTSADRVFGQYGDFTTNIESNDGGGNSGAPNADNLSHPKSMAIGPNGGLYITDTLHHRILYFANDGDTTADGSGGQFSNFETGVANNDGNGNSGSTSMDNVNGPQGIVIDANGLIYVSDTNNNRVLVIECQAWAG